MVKDATPSSRRKNGQKLVFGFANLQRDITFGVKVEKARWRMPSPPASSFSVADNRLDGATALANAQSFVQRNVDYVIEFQTDTNFGADDHAEDERGRHQGHRDRHPDAGRHLLRRQQSASGYMGGSYLAQAAINKFGMDKVKQGYFVVGELPQSGAIPAMRTGGQVDGFLAVGRRFRQDQVLQIDTKNTHEESFAQMNNVLGRIPDGVPIMVTAINDQSATGMLRAVKQAGREADLIVVGMGADEIQTLVDEPTFVASIGYFPERYGNYLLPIALAAARRQEAAAGGAGQPRDGQQGQCLPVLSRQFKCADEADFEYKFPQDASSPTWPSPRKAVADLKGFENLVPATEAERVPRASGVWSRRRPGPLLPAIASP